MLTIRLQRTGSKNKPEFRIVLAEAHRAASKKFLEVLGHYNPRSKNFGIKNEERLKYWLAQNIKVSPTVHNLLIEKETISGKKVKAWNPKQKAEAATAAPTASPPAEKPAAPPEAKAPAEQV
jgi:small subunit ribosomal protein S16